MCTRSIVHQQMLKDNSKHLLVQHDSQCIPLEKHNQYTTINCIKFFSCGGDMWNAHPRELHMLQLLINRCWRIILSSYWPNTISRKTTINTINEVIWYKWEWIGQSLRKPHDVISPITLGSRRRGKSTNAWRRKVSAEVVDTEYI